MKLTVNVTKDVTWIGVLDKLIKTFDVVMTTEHGTTYNSYFINADKKAIVDSSKDLFWDEYKEKVLSVVDPKEIEYVIVSHTEPDHSSCLRNLLDLSPNAKVVCSNSAKKFLLDQIGDKYEFIVVKDNDTLDLGNKTLRFISAPNLHWPDTIFTYLEEEKVLFTCDAFGAHYCHDGIFNDVDLNEAEYKKAFEFYFEVILQPFSKFMISAVEKIKDLDIDIIATGHGPIIRKNVKEHIEASKKLAEKALSIPQKNFVYMPYVSAYRNTKQVAEAIAEGIRSVGDIEVFVHDIEEASADEISYNLTKASAILVGTPTINQNILPPIYTLMALINPIRDKRKLCSGFGSFGWTGESRKILPALLTNLKLDYFKEGMFINFTLIGDRRQKCVDFGKEFGEEFLSRIK